MICPDLPASVHHGWQSQCCMASARHWLRSWLPEATVLAALLSVATRRCSQNTHPTQKMYVNTQLSCFLSSAGSSSICTEQAILLNSLRAANKKHCTSVFAHPAVAVCGVLLTCGICTAQRPIYQLLNELIISLQPHKLDSAGDVLQAVNDERQGSTAVPHSAQDVHLYGNTAAGCFSRKRGWTAPCRVL